MDVLNEAIMDVDTSDSDDEFELDKLIHDIFEESSGEEEDNEVDEGADSEQKEERKIHDMWSGVQDSDEFCLLKDRRFMVGERELLQLLRRSTCQQCEGKIDPSTIHEGEYIAAGIKYKFKCSNGHPGKWISTPFYGGRSFVHMVMQLMVILSGGSWERFSLGARFMNLAVGSATNFYKMQLQYRVAIEKFFLSHIQSIHKKLGGIPLSVAVDVRYDTPGFSANRSTAVFMDTSTQFIVHMEVGDSREVERHSPRMEKLLVERGLSFLVNGSPLVVWEVVSDASRTIISIMKTDPYKHLQHSLDVWHKSKKLASTLADLAKRSPFKELLPWIRSIVNHFWWCCSTCHGRVDKLLHRWSGILSHINNKHVWPGGRCRHPEGCEHPEGGSWLQRDSKAFKELRKIVTNREWLGTMKYYTNCRQTWAVENFFSHTLLHYCPKQNSYSYDAYNIRNMLAVIDHNHHKEREVAVGQDGAPYSQAQVSRRTKQWVAYERKRPKDFSYIPELMSACMQETYGRPLSTFSNSKKAMDLKTLQPNLSGKPNPGSKSLLAQMKGRKQQLKPQQL
ncbi:uncharacterized protein LOC111114234 [Crassostrea virginica]